MKKVNRLISHVSELYQFTIATIILDNHSPHCFMLVVKGTKEWKERGLLFFYWMGETEVAFYIFRELQ